MRIGLLECDHVDDRFRSIDGDYGEMFDRLLDVELVRYDAVNDVFPRSAAECDGWLVTGSRFSVHDQLPWIDRLQGFVRAIHAERAPYVGICFGHQLLAHALGGRTEKASCGWGVGAIDTRLQHGEAPSVLLYMHQDQVVALPDGATIIGDAPHCPVGALQVGSNMIGVQAHPEFSTRYVDALLDARADRIGRELTARAKASLERVGDARDATALGRWIVDFFEAQ
jgi:GMP synthase-like glutamine amidotransferase